MSDAIRVHCEGSGAAGHRWHDGRMCPMCGRTPGVDDTGAIVDHDRADILAMIDRGDFG